MAVLTKSAAVGAAWVEVGAALGMAAGKSYRTEVQDDAGTGEGYVIAAETSANEAPEADARGHRLYPRNAAGEGTRRTFKKTAARFWWMRSSGPAFHVVATEVAA